MLIKIKKWFLKSYKIDIYQIHSKYENNLLNTLEFYDTCIIFIIIYLNNSWKLYNNKNIDWMFIILFKLI